MKPIDLPALTPVQPAAPVKKPLSPSDAKRYAAAKQFEAVFMTEMLKLAHPDTSAVGHFAPGHAEKSWQVLMDQALGQAAVAKDTSGLAPQIEKAMRAAQAHQSTNGARK